MINTIPLLFATFMAGIDAIVLGWLKEYSLGIISWKLLPVGILIYALQPLVFLQSLKYETMTIMNILWDVISDIFVTCAGLFYFKEKISKIKQIGLALAFIAIILLSYDELYNTKYYNMK
jgi:drug/metabolite transporter (DMT)-like permease